MYRTLWCVFVGVASSGREVHLFPLQLDLFNRVQLNSSSVLLKASAFQLPTCVMEKTTALMDMTSKTAAEVRKKFYTNLH